jgi:hypothetical protein
MDVVRVFTVDAHSIHLTYLASGGLEIRLVKNVVM